MDIFDAILRVLTSTWTYTFIRYTNKSVCKITESILFLKESKCALSDYK